MAMLLMTAADASVAQADWLAETRSRIAASEFEAALAVVNERIEQAPEDMEARGWRGRIQQWMGRLAAAEADYRVVLERHPQDTDILVGLADVLSRQGRVEEALEALEQARQADPSRTDVHVRRGQLLRRLERRPEARAAFQHALSLSPDDAAARRGLDSLQPEARHELTVGTDIDRFNYTSTAQSFGANLRSKLSEHWTSNFGGAFYNRFGGRAMRLAGSVTAISEGRGALTLGGAVAPRDDGVIAKSEAFFEYDRGLSISRTAFVRGIEFVYLQRWLWYRGAHVLTLGPGAIVYLPRDWTWSIRVTAARSDFTGAPAEWSPSGSTRLGFPLHRRLTGNVFFAVGTENFVQVDEVGRFSARTWGGGLRWLVAKGQHIGGYVLYQDRSQERTQTSFGFTYGFSF
ncbi:MAG: tetratricopeptide repeat protein [Candidatus Acidiferrales bacterium]